MAIGETTEERRERVGKYIDFAKNKFKENNINYENYSEVHFCVEKDFDYWPTTGKFINRKTKKSGRGIFNLLKELKKVSR